MPDTSKRPLLIVGVVAVALILLGIVAWTARDSGSDDAPKGNNAAATEDGRADDPYGIARRDARDQAAIGAVDAPVVMVEYSDYRCPFCGVFARETLPKLMADYIDTGRLRYERRDMPVFGPESMLGAMAARAAGAQGKYWEYHEAVYRDAPARGHLTIDSARVVAWAEQVGVPDMQKFVTDLNNPVAAKIIESDTTEGRSLGVTGTPAFIIGSTPVFGAQPIEAFRAAIEKELAGAGVDR